MNVQQSCTIQYTHTLFEVASRCCSGAVVSSNTATVTTDSAAYNGATADTYSSMKQQLRCQRYSAMQYSIRSSKLIAAAAAAATVTAAVTAAIVTAAALSAVVAAVPTAATACRLTVSCMELHRFCGSNVATT